MNNAVRATSAPFAIVPRTVPARRRVVPRRCRRCDARLRDGNRSGMCSPCYATLHASLLREAEELVERATEEEERAARLVPARPKDLVVAADENDDPPRPTCNIVPESELRHWRYVEPPYGEKLRIGFAMLAGEPVRL